MNTQKIWLDTDIGSDIDDALALAFLLHRPDCELLGISTVTEIDKQRAKLASVLCRVAQKQVPIFPGARASLLVEPPQKIVPQAVALSQYAHESGHVAIETAEETHYGFTDWKADQGNTHAVALDVDAAKSFDLYLRTICD